MRFHRFDTALTIFCTFLCLVGVSFLPVPDAWKPIPAFAEKPFAEVVTALVWKSTRTPAQQAVPLESDGEEAPVEVETTEAEDEASSQATSRPVRSGFAGDVEEKQSKELETLRAAVGASHTDIIDVCRDPVGADGHACKQYALDPFFHALDAVEAGERKDPVRIVHLGDSLIASDYISDVLRRRLQKRFGNGGQGFMFVDRPSRFGGLKTRAGDASAGYEITKIPEPLASDAIYGFSAVSFVAKSNEHTRFDVKGAVRATVHYYAHPGGGDIEALADGKAIDKVVTRGEKATKTHVVQIPPGSKRLELRTRAGTRIFGVALERNNGGVTLESIGLPGAFAGAYLKMDAESFRQGLEARAPDLNIIMLGGNEALRLDNGWTNADAIKNETKQLLARVQSATPAAGCLVVSAFASGVSTVSSEIRVRKETKIVAKIQRDAAAEAGCAFYDVLEAQGGEASIIKFSEARLMNTDLVHPLRRGADLLGHLMETALQRAYFVRHGPDMIADPVGLFDPSNKALERIFRKMMRLEKEKKGRVAIMQLGASHTAGHMFTDEARALLQTRFGDAGRGYIAAGAPSARLVRAKVTRLLSKGWTVLDAMRAPQGEPWGLSGVRAVGKPQAHMEITFCDGCPPSKQPVSLKVYYLERPGSGKIEVRIDNKLAATIKPTAATEPTARIYETTARGLTHTIRVKNVGEGDITVFGVSEEIDKPGLVYDAVGLPGSTAIVGDGYEKSTFEAQLSDRAADLYVLFYGTNESAIPRFDASEYKRRYNSFLDTLQRASPEADCLILGPTDRMAQDENGVWQEVGSLRGVIAALRQIAEARGCAFWSTRAAMGGKDSIQRWLDRDPPEAHADHIHLSELGYQKLAQTFIREFTDAYSAYLVYAQSPSSLTQLEEPETDKKKKKRKQQ